MRNCTINVANNKTLISLIVTAKLICNLVFEYAKCWFYHDLAHFLKSLSLFFVVVAVYYQHMCYI